MNKLVNIISAKLNIKEKSVKEVVTLLSEGNTVPFIARYRKEQTGGLDEIEIRRIEEENNYFKNLFKRKEEIKSILKKRDELTEKLSNKLKKAETINEVEDIYRPYKEKRETRASRAVDNGLKPLANQILNGLNPDQISKEAKEYIDPKKELNKVEDIINGACDIIADIISNNSEVRKNIREYMLSNSKIYTEKYVDIEDETNKYQLYYEYKEKIKKIPNHRILAINRAEKEEILKVNLIHNEKIILNIIKELFLKEYNININTMITEIIVDSYKRLINPSLDREIRNILTNRAEKGAIEIFKKNLRSLLLTPPYKGKKIMGIDPAFRTGCKIAVIDQTGNLITYDKIYPHQSANQKDKATQILKKAVDKYEINTIAIGNGTASRETELFISELNFDRDLKYIIVNEAGASVYSASKEARDEFPDLDLSIRGAISIARRLQDPLSELVKIDPRSIGVGQYQHDVNQTELKKSLDQVVESVVNQVGVNLNTASSLLLKHVSGINSNVADNIIKYRVDNGKFKQRTELKKVYGIGTKTFEQASGFLRFYSKEDPFAFTSIHPEDYKDAENILNRLGFNKKDILNKNTLKQIREKLDQIDKINLINELDIGKYSLQDIIRNFKKPGLDPRDELPDSVFKNEIIKFSDLEAGMNLHGIVRNVVDFGAFVDIGVKQDGLIHISELSEKYVEHPLDIISIGERVIVKIIDLDKKRNRISLTRKM
ncbi:MAG: RNA-binding transcriptional accessory protein [Halanaerobiales bacterium]|nr:RNA-binding transcriptional accessory protein [Halanaerobiales bacterium]